MPSTRGLHGCPQAPSEAYWDSGACSRRVPSHHPATEPTVPTALPAPSPHPPPPPPPSQISPLLCPLPSTCPSNTDHTNSPLPPPFFTHRTHSHTCSHNHTHTQCFLLHLHRGRVRGSHTLRSLHSLHVRASLPTQPPTSASPRSAGTWTRKSTATRLPPPTS